MQKKICTILFLLLTTFVWSQTQEELEQRKSKIQKEIQEKERMLQEVKGKEKSVIKLLEIQKDKIGLKEKLISTTEKQTKLLNNNMYINQVKINKLKSDLDELKKDYAQMVVKSYKSRSTQSRAMFILSSENFLQAYKRLQYMKQYSSYRKMQGLEIKEKTTSLLDYNNKIKVQKTEKDKLLADQEKQKQDLEKEKKEQEKIANSLKKNKAQILAEIKKKQQENRKIDAQIQRLIREAIAEANRKAAAAKAKANPKTTKEEIKKIENSSKIILNTEGQLISNNFKANKGRLPWPVERGTIVQGFGRHTHQIYKNIETINNGIDISAESGSNARAVFGGEVTQVQMIYQKKVVYVKHGDFFTIYENLSSINVSVGDKVSPKQVLGKIKTDAEGKTILKFMIFQNTIPTDPSGWLNR